MPIGMHGEGHMHTEKIIICFKDDTCIKGHTSDFAPARRSFQIRTEDGRNLSIDMDDLKTIFFVRDLGADPKDTDFFFLPEEDMRSLGRCLQIKFKDGDVLEGKTLVSYIGRKGFFLHPCATDSIVEKVFILRDALEHIIEIGSCDEDTFFTPPPV